MSPSRRTRPKALVRQSVSAVVGLTVISCHQAEPAVPADQVSAGIADIGHQKLVVRYLGRGQDRSWAKKAAVFRAWS